MTFIAVIMTSFSLGNADCDISSSTTNNNCYYCSDDSNNIIMKTRK